MTRFRLFCILTFCLILTVPWFFEKFQSWHILGFPPWAFYTICTTILYAVLIAFFLNRYLSVFARDDEEDGIM